MSYLPSEKLIRNLVKQECLKTTLYGSALTDAHRTKDVKTKDGKDIKETIPMDAISASTYKSAFTTHIQRTGVKSYLEQMTQVNLTTLYQEFRPEGESEIEKNKKKSKVFLVKKISYGIVEDFEGYFESLKGEEANIFYALTASKTWSKIVEEITLVGIEIFLFTLPAKLLGELCTIFTLKVQSNNPTVMVTAILMNTVPPKKEAPAKKVITFSKNKLKLKKGITYHDIFQHYYVDELSAFCATKGMKVSGNKKELINRILKYLNEGIKEVPNAKRIAKKAASDAAAAAAEQEVTDEEEEEEFEEEEVEEEAQEEEVEEDEEDAEYQEAEVEEPNEPEVPEVPVETTPSKLKKSSSVSKVVSPSPVKAKKNRN